MVDRPAPATRAPSVPLSESPEQGTPTLGASDASDASAEALAVAGRPSPFTLGGGCRWIDGDTRAPGGPRFCAATREPGRPYCRAHCLRAYAGLQRIDAATMAEVLAAQAPPAPDGVDA